MPRRLNPGGNARELARMGPARFAGAAPRARIERDPTQLAGDIGLHLVRLDQFAEPVVRLEVRETDDVNDDLVAALIGVQEVPLEERIDGEARHPFGVIDRHDDHVGAQLGPPAQRAVERVEADSRRSGSNLTGGAKNTRCFSVAPKSWMNVVCASGTSASLRPPPE